MRHLVLAHDLRRPGVERPLLHLDDETELLQGRRDLIGDLDLIGPVWNPVAERRHHAAWRDRRFGAPQRSAQPLEDRVGQRNGTFVRTRNFPLIDADMPTFMGQPHAVTTKDLEAADVVIIGAPYVASWQEYAGVAKSEWIAGPKRVRQQSIRYATGYIQDLD